ncbi:aminomethyltransferase, mitochondrial-like protein, partial [Euroglyphus maynei]
MVPFAGYSMPISYNDLSIRDSHLHTRSNVSLFDVSHMLQLELYGKDRIKFLEKLVVADVESLPINGATLTLYTNANGGIIDDLIVSKKPDALYIVSNASRSEEDLKHLEEQMAQFIKTNPDADLNLKILDDKSLLAFQGPKAAETIQAKLESVDLNSLKFMNGIETVYDGIDIRLTRCGYTGEDGFEIQVSNKQAVDLADKLLQSPVSKLAGLGARDSLRLEAGLCLYGNDINMTTTPIQATLAWTIAKSRRAQANFLGAEIILQELKDKPKIKRIGLIGTKPGPPVRAGSKIYKDS